MKKKKKTQKIVYGFVMCRWSVIIYRGVFFKIKGLRNSIKNNKLFSCAYH